MNVITHPATIVSAQSITDMKKRVAEKHPQTIRALAKLEGETPANYVPKACSKVCVMWNGSKQGEEIALDDGPMAYRLVLKYLLTGKTEFAERAMGIIEAWISVCKECTGDNAQLSASWSQVNFARVLEMLLFFYRSEKTTNMKRKYIAWYDTVMLPAIDKPITWKFAIDKAKNQYDTYTNWHCSILEARLQVALLKDDVKAARACFDMYKVVLPEIIEMPWKLCNETIYRDVMHGCMSLGSLVHIAEMAWNQKCDLYGYKDNLLKDAIEATAAVCCGEIPSGLPVAALNKVQYWPYGWYIAYNHYVGRCKMSMPKTRALIAKHPVDYSWLFSSSCALTHACGVTPPRDEEKRG